MQRTVAVATLLAALLLIAVGAAGGSGRPATAPPRSFARHPQSAALPQGVFGHLWATNGCALSVVALPNLDVRRAPGAHCRVWPDSGGTIAAVTDGALSSQGVDRRLTVLDASGPTLRVTGEIAYPRGVLASPVAWRDTATALFCVQTPGGRVLADATRARRWGVEYETQGCLPQPAGDNLWVAHRGRLVYNGVPLERVFGASFADIVRWPPDQVAITALTVTGNVVATGIGRLEHGVPRPPFALVETDLRRRRSVSVRLGSGSAIEAIGVAPGGQGAWVTSEDGTGAELVPSVSGKTVPAGVPDHAEAFAWSPDGRYLAVAQPGGVAFYDLLTGARTPLPGVAADTLSWTL